MPDNRPWNGRAVLAQIEFGPFRGRLDANPENPDVVDAACAWMDGVNRADAADRLDDLVDRRLTLGLWGAVAWLEQELSTSGPVRD